MSATVEDCSVQCVASGEEQGDIQDLWQVLRAVLSVVVLLSICMIFPLMLHYG